MSITMTTVILFAVFGVLLFLGVPISISIVASSIVTARGGAVDLAALHQKGERFAPGVQRRADDLGAFGDEDTLFGLQLIAQLGLGEPGVRSQLGGG